MTEESKQVADEKNPAWNLKYRVRRDAATPMYPSMINLAKQRFRVFTADFGMKIYHALSTNEALATRNMIFSPCLAQFPLLPLYAIAEGELKQDIKRTLGMEEFSDDVIHSNYQYAYYRLNQHGRRHDQWRPHGIKMWHLHPVYILMLKESIIPPFHKWYDDRARTFKCYQNVLHGVRIEKNFGKGFASLINDFVTAETNCVFDERARAFPENGLQPECKIAMLSAMFYKASLVNGCNVDHLKRMIFNLTPEMSVNTNFLCNQTLKEYAENDECQVLGLEFIWGSLTLYILLPKSHLDLPTFQKGMTAEKLTAVLREAAMHRVHKKFIVKYAVPEFRIRSQHDLRPIFREHLNLGCLFDETQIKLGPFMQPPLEAPSPVGFISQSVAIVVEKNIKGELNRFARPAREPPKPTDGETIVQFTADRPFMFVIYDARAQIYLFMGRVTDPRVNRASCDW